jgi:hypothetical protein
MGNDGPKMVQIAARAAEIEGVTSNIRSASRQTGVSFDYLMAQAKKESAMTSDAKSQVSSAAGLFQFTKSTWLQLVKLHGEKYGLGAFAEMIHKTPQGDYTVSDPDQRQHILSLRKDPSLSSLIAGEYAKDNRHWLEKSLGRKVGSTELYLAHFLGPAGAVKLLKAKAENPDQAAADLVPQAAAKNQTMFYGADHSAQSVAALYNRVHQVMENPGHPPHRAAPPAELAVAALRYGNLPWTDHPAADTPNADQLLATVRMTVQAYTDRWQSADRISAPMPGSVDEAIEKRVLDSAKTKPAVE